MSELVGTQIVCFLMHRLIWKNSLILGVSFLLGMGDRSELCHLLTNSNLKVNNKEWHLGNDRV